MSTLSQSSLPIFLPSTARILVVRPDRLGDMILSTPVLEVLRRSYPKARISVLVQPRVAPALRGLQSVDELIEFDPEGLHAGWAGFRRLIKDLRQRQFDFALVLQAPSRVAWALLLARIPIRLGPLSKWYSFLTYNRGIRQRRSEVEMHEADYNLQLLQPLEIFVGTRTVPTRVAISSGALHEVQRWFQDQGVSAQSRRWIGIHPGMGGSALNWPEAHYLALVETLLGEGLGVVMTGGPGEQGILDQFSGQFGSREGFRVYGGENAPDVQRLAAVYQGLELVIAPSTGPLHVAVAVGTPVVAFYPPIRVQSARRWGPYREKSARVLTPQVYCGQDFRCLGERCASYPCMKTISVERVVSEVRELLAEKER